MYLAKYVLGKIKAIPEAISTKINDARLSAMCTTLTEVVGDQFIIVTYRPEKRFGFVLHDAMTASMRDHEYDEDVDGKQVMIDAIAFTNEILVEFDHPLCHQVRDLNANLIEL